MILVPSGDQAADMVTLSSHVMRRRFAPSESTMYSSLFIDPPKGRMRKTILLAAIPCSPVTHATTSSEILWTAMRNSGSSGGGKGTRVRARRSAVTMSCSSTERNRAPATRSTLPVSSQSTPYWSQKPYSTPASLNTAGSESTMTKRSL